MSDDQKAEETQASPAPEAKASPSEALAKEGAPADSTTPPAGPPVSVAPTPDPLPVEAKPAAGQTPGLQQPTTVPSRPPIDYAMPAQKSFIPTPTLIRNVGCLIKLIAGFTVLLCLGYLVLVALNPKARQWALQGSKPGPGGTTGKGPTPFKIVNQILAIPAQALGKTDDVVKANNARVGQLDKLVAEEEAKGGKGAQASRPVADPFTSAGGATATTDAAPQAVSSAAMLALAEKRAAANPYPTEAPVKPTEAKASPSEASAKEGPDQMKLPGDIIIAHASPAGSPRASTAFFYWVVKLNVSGVTQSKPARLLLNGRLTHEGDEVHRPLGIVFARLDSAKKLLIFQDATGATVTRSY